MATKSTRAAVARALREFAILWRPPDPENDNARRAPGAGETGLDNELDYTPSNPEAGKPDLLAALSRRVWTFSYSLEEARQRYAASGKVLREVCVCVALALLRLGGARHV